MIQHNRPKRPNAEIYPDSDEEVIKKFPVSDSDSESEKRKPWPKKIIRKAKQGVNAIIDMGNSATVAAQRAMLSENVDDSKHKTSIHDQLDTVRASATYGQSEVTKGDFLILLRMSKGKTIYENIEETPITSQNRNKYRIANPLKLQPRKIYVLELEYDDEDGNKKIYRDPIGFYILESVIEGENTFGQVRDFCPFFIDMVDGKLVAVAAEYTLFNLTQATFALTEQLAPEFPSTITENIHDGTMDTTYHWDEEIAQSIALNALTVILRQLAYQIHDGKYPISMKLYEYNTESESKEALKAIQKQSSLTPINLTSLINHFLISNEFNMKDFENKLEKLEGLHPSKLAIADNLERQMLANQWIQQWQQNMPTTLTNEAAAIPTTSTTKKEERRDIQIKAIEARRKAEAEAEAKKEEGGSLKKTKTKKKRSKKHRKTKKHMNKKTNKRRKYRSNKSKKYKR